MLKEGGLVKVLALFPNYSQKDRDETHMILPPLSSVYLIINSLINLLFTLCWYLYVGCYLCYLSYRYQLIL